MHLDLAPHVHLCVLPRDLRLVEHLERADEARLAVAHQVDAPELALAEGAADLEEAEVEFLGRGDWFPWADFTVRWAGAGFVM